MAIKVSVVAEFGAVLAEYGLSPSRAGSLAARLIPLATRLEALHVKACNEPVPPTHGVEVQRLEEEVLRELRRACVLPSLVRSTIFNRDPRGAAVKLVLPSGRTNDFGGEGYCVPVSSRG